MENIRLVVWDLDETFWKGTLSEGPVHIPSENIQIIKELTNRGIINSICSKNDFEPVKIELEKSGLWDYFVFPKISWDAKGPQVKAIVDQIKLRPETILFIDDNSTNLEEVKFFVPNINVSGPEIITSILDDEHFKGKDDSSHSRLKQYQILEKKAKDEIKYADNHEFLRHSNIRVVINYDCDNMIDRIWELNQRTNQLNFTKNRVDVEEIKRIIDSKDYKCATVSVSDNYGQYGIVGFFALNQEKLEHFYFSCRTIGLGIEQYVYAQIGFPEIDIVGNVATSLIKDYCPDWINMKDSEKTESVLSKIKTDSKILMMGGCDLEQTAFYLEQTGLSFDTQFNYVANNRFDCHPEAMENLRNSISLTKSEKTQIIQECPFYDDKVFDNKIFSNKYDIIIFSPLIDMANGLYRRKDTDQYVVYGNIDFPTLQGHAYMSVEEQKEFSTKYEFIGKTPAKRFHENLVFLRNHIDKNIPLIFINGSEQKINNPIEPNRHILHKELNKEIQNIVNEYDNCYLINVNDIIKSESNHTDTIRHYERQVYYKIALSIIDVLKNIGIAIDNVRTDNLKSPDINYRNQLKKYLRKLGLLRFFYKM